MAKKASEDLISDENFDSIVDGITKAVNMSPVNLLRGKFVENTISSGALAVDLILGGGWPGGRWSVAFGPEGCLSGDSFIQYEVRHPDGRRANHKGGTIENLHQRFNGIDSDDRIGRPPVNDGMEFFAPSVNEEGRVFQNKIVRVVKTGRKKTFHVVTDSGHSIRATEDHRFYIGAGQYRRLRELDSGSTVYIHNSTPFTKEKEPKANRAEVYVKAHPNAPTKLVDGKYLYHRLSRARAVVEAQMNRLTMDDFVQRLNAHDLDGLVFLRPEQHVHHMNENPTDDRPENLQVLDGVEHNKHHAIKEHNNLRYVAVPAKIVSIEDAGECDTYDLTMEGPHHNYIANGIVVHNSGKSTLSFFAMAAAVKQNVPIFHFDPEGAADPSYMNRIGLKTDWAKEHAKGKRVLYRYYQPETGEQVFRAIHRILKAMPDVEPGTNKIQAMFVLDSLPFMVPEKRYENDESSPMAQQAKMFADNIGLIRSPLAAKNCVLYAVNQLRMRPGVSYGDPAYEPCGETPKFASDVRLRVSKRSVPSGKGGLFEEERCWDGVGNDRYIYSIMRTVKNRMFSPFRETWMRIWFEEKGAPGRGVDPFYDTYQYLTMTGQLEEHRGYFTPKVDGFPETRMTWEQFKALSLDPEQNKTDNSLRALCRKQFATGEAFDRYFGSNGGKVGERAGTEADEDKKPDDKEVAAAENNLPKGKKGKKKASFDAEAVETEVAAEA